MGRAQGHRRAVAADRFSSVLGATRGLAGDGALDLDAPSEAARRNLDVLLAEVRAGTLEDATEALRAHCRRLRVPLLAELHDAVAHRLYEDVLAKWTPAMADYVDVVAGDGNADHVLLDSDDNRTLHLWPQGDRHAEPAPGSALACGTAADPERLERVPRGWWATRAGDGHYEACAGCAQHAAEFPETTENGNSVFPAHHEPQLSALLHMRLHAMVAQRSAGVIDPTPIKLALWARSELLKATREIALERLRSGGGPLLQRLLQVAQLGAEMSPSRAAALQLLSRKDFAGVASAHQPRVARLDGQYPAGYATRMDNQRQQFARALLGALDTAHERARHPGAFNYDQEAEDRAVAAGMLPVKGRFHPQSARYNGPAVAAEPHDVRSPGNLHPRGRRASAPPRRNADAAE